MKVIPLSEGSFTVDRTKVFTPFDENKDTLSERPQGSLLVEVQPFVVITDNDILLLDAGLGFRNENGVLQIHQNMMDNGINPSEVTKVLMSHLHKDHSGGVSCIDQSEGTRKLTFPSAMYYIQKQELEFALSEHSSSYIKKELDCLKDSSHVQLINGDGDIDGYIHYEMTAAHSKYHQVFWIKEDDQTIFFGGDDAPQYQQMKSRYVAKYDYNGKKCMQLRHEWWQKGQEEHWMFLFYHDIKKAVMDFSSK
jgi:glyoxylase-like metal-dependent hydrolase (beta-lactamase superfamily II)